jgi:SAM-dependent methyltransferase
MNIKYLLQSQEKPAPFTPGEPLFWDDPHISTQMLKAHLDTGNDLASRRPETIQRSVDWMIETLGLQPSASILDLGCGPGLYATRLAEQGLRVTGVDYSRRSIEGQYNAALLIYGDFCPLSPAGFIFASSHARDLILCPEHRCCLDHCHYSAGLFCRPEKSLVWTPAG